jgi:hypothetical protein
MKAWKITQVVGFLLLVIGVIARAGAGEYWGTGLALVGVIVLAIGRVGAWLKSDQP